MQWIVGLNMLRFFAIILIVIYHFFRSFMPGGFLAIEIFFALSGYLLGTKLLSKTYQEKQKSPLSFIKKRFMKLWPPLLACVLISLSFALFSPKELLVGLQKDTLAALTFTTNIFELISGASYEETISPNLFEHTWFLALEFQLCLILPFFIYLTMRKVGRKNGLRLCLAYSAAISLLSAGLMYAYGTIFEHTWFLALEFQLCLILPFFIHLTMRKVSRKNGLRLCLAYSTAISLLSAGLMYAYGTIFEMRDRAYFAPDTQAFAFFGGVALAAWRQLRPISIRHRRRPALLSLIVSSAALILLSFSVTYERATAGFLQLTAILSLILINSILYLQKTRTNTLKIMRPLEFLGKYAFGIYLYHWPLMLLLPRIFGINQVTNFVVTLILSLVLSVLTGFVLNRNIKTRLTALPMPALLSAIALILTPLSSNIMNEIREAKSDESLTVSVNYLQTPRLDKITTEMEALAKTAKEPVAPDEPISLASVSPNDASVLVIGDSVTLGAKAALESKIINVYVDAEESRGIEKAHTILDAVAASGDVPPIVVVSLTTNERTFTDEIMQEIVDAARGSRVIFVTGYASELQPRETQNAAIKDFANSRNNVYYADWWEVAINDMSLLYDDHIHLNPEGREAYANLIYNSIEQTGGML